MSHTTQPTPAASPDTGDSLDERIRSALATMRSGQRLESICYTRITWSRRGRHSPTHLADAHNRHSDPSGDAYALCGKPLPDREFFTVEFRDHPPRGDGETYCEQCLQIFALSRAGDEQLPDKTWVKALANYRDGKPTEVPWSEPAKEKWESEADELFAAWRTGHPFALHGLRYEVHRPGEARLFRGETLLMTERRVRCVDKPQMYIEYVRLEPCVRHSHPESLERQVIDAILSAGHFAIQNDDGRPQLLLLSPTAATYWPEDRPVVLSRHSDTEQFRAALPE